MRSPEFLQNKKKSLKLGDFFFFGELTITNKNLKNEKFKNRKHYYAPFSCAKFYGTSE